MELDDTDREIIYHLLRNGRISQAELASLLKVSQASISYRIKRLEEEKVIKGFKLLANPNFYRMYFAYVAFRNNKDISYPWIFVKFNCLEELNVYGIEGETHSQIEDRIDFLSKELGEPDMIYFPDQTIYEIRPTELKLLLALNKAPRASPGEIASMTGIGVRYATTKIKNLIEKGVISVVPEIDFNKLNASILAIFGRVNVDYLTGNCRLFSVNTESSYIDVCFVKRLDKAAEYVKRVRNIDPLARVMIVTDFSVRGLPEQYLKLT